MIFVVLTIFLIVCAPALFLYWYLSVPRLIRVTRDEVAEAMDKVAKEQEKVEVYNRRRDEYNRKSSELRSTLPPTHPLYVNPTTI